VCESNRRIFYCVLVYVQIGTSRFESNKQMSQLTVSPINGDHCTYFNIIIILLGFRFQLFYRNLSLGE